MFPGHETFCDLGMRLARSLKPWIASCHTICRLTTDDMHCLPAPTKLLYVYIAPATYQDINKDLDEVGLHLMVTINQLHISSSTNFTLQILSD